MFAKSLLRPPPLPELLYLSLSPLPQTLPLHCLLLSSLLYVFLMLFYSLPSPWLPLLLILILGALVFVLTT